MEDALDRPLAVWLHVMQQRIMERTTYHGIPTLKNPLDFWVYQEIMWDSRPDVVVEIGNFRGGSTLALAHMADLVGHGRIVAVDRDHDGIAPRAKAHPRITFVTGKACDVVSTVAAAIPSGASVMVLEDSAHTYEHTSRVLEAYSPLVTPGQYFIVEDGICHHGLDVGPKPGPYEAVEAFVRRNPDFVVDRDKESFGITWNPKGYLKRTPAGRSPNG